MTGLPELDVGPDAELAIVAELGRGAMGRVMLAEQRSLRRSVAIKTLRDGAVTPFTVRGLVTEAVILGQLEHPNIVPVHQLGTDDRGLPALVMKQVSGVAWGDLLRAPDHPILRRFGRAEIDPLDGHVEILMHVCDALHFAHQRGILHRDVKVDNVMVGEHGEVYLMDWGLAISLEDEVRLTNIVGTPGYMAPEMVRGSRLSVATDVFLLGATLHFLLAGRVRHEGKTTAEMLKSAAWPEPVAYDPDVPRELADLANRATSVDPDQRPESAEAFRAQLASWRRHRASHLLCREATVRLARIEGLRAAGGLEGPELMRLSAECRFGFLQALREWPENVDAQRGLRSCLKQMIAWSVEHEDAASARGLLAELSTPSKSLDAAVTALEARLRSRQARAAQADSLVRERDLNVGGENRLRLLLVVTGSLSIVRLGIIAWRGPEEASRPQTLLGVGLFAFLVLTVGAWLGRREVLRNAINRQVVGMLILMLLGITLNRIHGWVAGVPGESIMAVDALIATLSGALAAISVRRGLAWVAVVNLVGAAVSTRWPELAAYSFTLSSIAGLALVAYVLERDRVEPVAQKAP